MLVKALVRSVAAASLVVIMAGCTGGTGADDNERPSLEQIASDAKDNGHEWQAKVLSDGNITLAEYDEAHRRNLQCLDAAGVTYTTPVRNLTNGYEWLYDMKWAPSMSDGEGQKVSADCFEESLGEISLAMQAWGDWSTDPTLLADVVTCVEKHDYDVDPGVKTLRDVWLSATKEGLTREFVAACADTAMLRLYPGVSYGLDF